MGEVESCGTCCWWLELYEGGNGVCRRSMRPLLKCRDVTLGEVFDWVYQHDLLPETPACDVWGRPSD